MATRVVQILSDFIRWRWAPFIGLVSASLFYVLFVILLIPSQVGATEPEEEGTALELPEAATGERGEDTPESDAATGASGPVKHIERSSPLTAPVAPKRRGFSPPLERPDPNPPAPPAPATPVPPPPAPPPGVTQELPQAPPPPDPPPEEQARTGAAAAARAATLAATRASRLSGRGLRPRMGADVVGQPVHEENEESDVEADSEAPDTSNADRSEGSTNDGNSEESDDDAPAEAEQNDDDSDE